jgi:cell division septation protein DedD
MYLPGAFLFCAATLSAAQTPARPTDPVFVRAQTLVSDGNGAAGRALIDSVIAATPLTARLYPEALFWRASLASNAADAESDYKHIVVDYPLAPQAEDALLRLAQLELARGDREGALIHLQRISRDYPRSKSLARASYWTARVLFEKNDIPNACAANANALAQAGEGEIELRNQIQYQGQRCPVVAAAAAPVTVPASAASGAKPVTSTTASSTPTTVVASPATVSASSTPPTTSPVPVEKVAPVDPPFATVTAPTSTPTKPTAKAASSSRSGSYSVQVAAYTRRNQADKLVSSLTKRGFQARVDGNVAPFRVRIGRYATSREAEDALTKIKAKHMDGFVARVLER